MVNAANPKAGPCPCNPGGTCTCATVRKSKRSVGPEPPLDPSAVKPSTGHEYRRVLPKPPNTSPVPPSRPGPFHNPSSTASGKQSQRPHLHAESYSPYERAYDANHSHHASSDHSESGVSPLEAGPSPMSRTPGNQGSFDWSAYPSIPVRSLCSCGDSCPCSGCFEHRGPSAIQAYQESSSSPACANPNYCTSCVECAVVLGHPSQHTPSPGSFDTQSSSFMDDWLRQLIEGLPVLPADGNTLHPDTPMPGRSTHSPPEPGFCVCAGECFGECRGAWRGEGDSTSMSIGPTGSLPPVGLDNGWSIPIGDQSWIPSDGSSEGEMMPGVNPAGDFNWGV
jgi:hypothetical protein